MSTGNPLVSVVMPVYNAERYVHDAVRSILQQTHAHLELIVVNDGSTDGSVAVLEQFDDPRMCVIHNPRNMGLVASLNVGIAAAHGRYIARMDADDEAMPTRLAAQVQHMEQYPEVGLCGTWYENMGDMQGEVHLETGHDAIVFRLLYQFHMLHPSWMMRKQVLDQYALRYELLYGEDYELLMRFIRHARVSNIPQVLMRYRQFGQSMSKSNAAITARHCLDIRQRLFADMGIVLTHDELRLFEQVMHQDYRPTLDFIARADHMLYKLWSQHRPDSVQIGAVYFRQRVEELWEHCFLNTTALGWAGFWYYLGSYFRKARPLPSLGFAMRFPVKCLLRASK
jgi:glycosyltransferase involved in cell wall biosynthesis